MSSAAEAEMGALFYNAKFGRLIRTTLEELVHPQPATPMQIDNSNAADGIVNNKLQKNLPKPRICIFIGSNIEFARAITTYFGNLALLI